ncbi:MAG: tRNA (N6-isopentenyl adenosine(37)-C2)-methylthiotransferase MiaB [Nitrospirae bacterium]|nr:tRNA (N6-isopentenyl adenosine(37)-C2)-methylthiotransferase MiaB [Nitrospirota bacterium]
MPDKVYIHTFGCQMNVHDSEKIAGILKAEGYVETESPQNASLIIFNTCCIRQKAEQKFFSELGRIKPLKKRNPSLKIAVTGCIAQQEGSRILKRAPHVDYVIGPQNINLLKNIIKSSSVQIALEDNPLLADIELPVERTDNVKAWVNIMYGCNNFCSYCVVPYTRGREKSRASDSIISEIRKLAETGYKEVTLLGQNVNSYKSNTDFPGLLKAVNEIDGIERVRFVTSNPKDLSEELIHAIRGFEKVCEHIHLPLQSGSTKILRLMNRKYTYEDYIKKVGQLKREIPCIAITSDIIAGFPKETDKDHLLTINALREIEFDGIFAFKFSPRPGTKAAEMDGMVTEDIKLERLSEILALQDKITLKKNKALEGTIQEVLSEGDIKADLPGKMTGRTRTNKITNFVCNNSNTGRLVNVKIIKAQKHSLEGELV